jgi:hypothetical protein
VGKSSPCKTKSNVDALHSEKILKGKGLITKNYKNLSIFFFCIIICTSSKGFTKELNSLKQLPWKVGDTWTVRTWNSIGGFSQSGKEKSEIIRKGIPIEVTFKINKIISTKNFEIPYRPSVIEERIRYNNSKHPENGYECFEIQVIYPKTDLDFQSRYLLYFRKDTFNLIRILNNSIRPDGTLVNLKTDYPIDPNGPVFTDDIPSSIPFDWPDWQKNEITLDIKPNVKVAGITKMQKIKKETLSDNNSKPYDVNIVTLTVKNKESGKDIVRIEQKWKLGLPWWTEAKRYNDKGEIVYEAELITSEQTNFNY